MKQEKMQPAPSIGTPSTETLAFDELKKIKDRCQKFTGILMGFIYRPHNGFADYAIVRLRLEGGRVVDVENVSDPYAAFEARAHMETKQAYELEKMRRSYPGEHRHV